ncbi:signal peptidase I [Nonomuraea rhodomycinica]|uniref:Signal peptidase I n=1 Tax=Nonomuraea rhodomycinica TaxID=1712872 RepID=A0A7Y6MDU8_9ACTN|nr:signal peptidase I [Nonomuraea rhodomycinica]NUW44898.1 signal peptidase I [Nonomuraea rhodomycinica]
MIRPRLSALSLVLLLTPVAGCASADLGIFDRTGYTMTSQAMEPTIKHGAHMSVRRVGDAYVPRVGDVIVYREPEGWSVGTPDPERTYVSRVIGVPGSTVKCCDSHGRLELDGKALDEPYIAKPPASDLDFDVQVPRDRIWIMSDNRHSALDSRSHQDAPGTGTISVSDVVGVVEDPRGS